MPQMHLAKNASITASQSRAWYVHLLMLLIAS